jgi:hypothetical protein
MSQSSRDLCSNARPEFQTPLADESPQDLAPLGDASRAAPHSGHCQRGERDSQWDVEREEKAHQEGDDSQVGGDHGSLTFSAKRNCGIGLRHTLGVWIPYRYLA